MKDTKYCICCDEQVQFSVIEKHEKIEVKCAYCGFLLDVQKLSELKKNVEEGYTLVADDSKYTRRIIEDILKDNKFSGYVESFENGASLVSAYSKLLFEKKPVYVTIIDLNMPVMDGLTTAMTIRTIEAQKNVSRVPIVFFSGVKADEELKRKLEELSPAVYMNKSTDPDPDKLAKRVEELLRYILAEYRHQ
ncbi:MAG: response regulator [Nitrospirae bacterium]|nr:response regulator [Nitrospirota bacterium]